MQLTVPFSDIPEHGIECEVNDTSWFPVEDIEPAGEPIIHVRLTKKRENRIELKGAMQANVLLECDRCLEQYTFHVDSPMQIVVEVADDERWKMQELEITAAELEIVIVDEPVVELGELFRQQLLLAVPEKRLCKERCAGLCTECGADLNKHKCECSDQPVDSPFAVLKGLKK